MKVETDKWICNHLDVCSREDISHCDHSKPHNLRSPCTGYNKCRDMRGVVCVPVIEDLNPDWEV